MPDALLERTALEQERSLPNGWRWARLGEVGTYVNGRAFKPEEWGTTGLPIVRIQNLNSVEAVPNYYAGEVEERYMINHGDLLISWSASLDAYIWQREPAVLNQHIFKVVVNTDLIDKTYLYYVVRRAMSHIRAQVHGATMQHITKPEFEAIRIPLPPLPDQRRIATILTEQMEAAEQALTAAEAQLQAARELPGAFLRTVFDKSEADGWTCKPLSALLKSPLNTGVSKPGDNEATIRCLTLSAVRNGWLDMSVSKPVSITDREASGNWVRPGAFYVVRGNGNPSLVGRGGLAPSTIDLPTLYPDLLIEVVAYPSVLLPDYLRLVWDSEQIRTDIMGRSRTSAGIYKINLANLGAVLVPVPPLSTQVTIVQRLNRQVGDARKAIAVLEQQLLLLKDLPFALLEQAFSGGL